MIERICVGRYDPEADEEVFVILVNLVNLDESMEDMTVRHMRRCLLVHPEANGRRGMMVLAVYPRKSDFLPFPK